LDVVKSVQGLGNIEAMDGYMLTDKLNPRQFAELIDLDVEVAIFSQQLILCNHDLGMCVR